MGIRDRVLLPNGSFGTVEKAKDVNTEAARRLERFEILANKLIKISAANMSVIEKQGAVEALNVEDADKVLINEKFPKLGESLDALYPIEYIEEEKAIESEDPVEEKVLTHEINHIENINNMSKKNQVIAYAIDLEFGREEFLEKVKSMKSVKMVKDHLIELISARDNGQQEEDQL